MFRNEYPYDWLLCDVQHSLIMADFFMREAQQAIIVNNPPCIGRTEGYCNCFVCMSVCRQNSTEPMNISSLKLLPADFESYKDQK